MKFLCDQMLAGLGKWLRIAGYDTQIIDKTLDDQIILEEAIKEKRLLLTRDKHFLEMKAPENLIFFLHGNSLEAWACELNEKLKINWLYKPFSRCLICNSTFIQPDDSMIESLPQDIRSKTKLFWYCPKCNKIYWEGGHTNRMLLQLKALEKIHS